MNDENIRLFSKVPKSTQIKYFIAEINFKYNEYAHFFSPYNRQKIIARQIMEKCGEVLAAPVKMKVSHIHLLLPRNFNWQTDFKKVFDDFNICLNGPYTLCYAIYLECISFALNFKLCSKWKRVENYFIKTENFLKTNASLQSIQLNYLLTDGGLVVLTQPFLLKFSILSLVALGVDFQTLNTKGFVEIRESVLVLPDNKQGTAIAVYSKLPNSSPFKEYSEIKKYWKILHDYDLPDTEKNMIYIEVIFNWSYFSYIYPRICVLSCKPLQFPLNNCQNLQHDFKNALKSNFLQICGEQLEFKSSEENNKYYPENIMKENSSGLSYSKNPIIRRPLEKKCTIVQPKSDERFTFSLKNQTKSKPPISRLAKKFTSNIKVLESHTKSLTEKLKLFKNIESSAQLKRLNIFTVPVLLLYCKENNIEVKSKRKQILIQKIYNHFTVD